MKSTVITLFTTLLMTFALSACTQDQGDTGGMGDTSATGSSGQGQMSDDRSVDLPQESPASGDRVPGAESPDTGVSPDTGIQSPDTTTGPGASSSPGLDSSPGASGSSGSSGVPESGTTSSTPEVEATPPSEDEQGVQEQDQEPRSNY